MHSLFLGNDVQQAGYCPRGVFCAFAHVDTEIANAREMVAAVESGGLAEILSGGLSAASEFQHKFDLDIHKMYLVPSYA